MANKEKVKAVLFDLDGVLIDSVDTWHSAFNETLQKFGKSTLKREEFVDQYWGSELEVNMERLNLGERGAEDCRKNYEKKIEEVRLLPVSRKTLSSLERKIGLVTSTPYSSVEKILNHFALEHYFNAIVTGDDVEKPKPNPEPVLKACKLLDISPNKITFVGDTKADMEAGKRAGCTVVGLV